MPDGPGRRTLSRDDRRRIAVSVPATILLIALALFLPAGSLAWTRGWLFLAIFLAINVIAAVVLWRVNPEIYTARARFHPGTKRWDKVILAFFLPIALAIFPVAALDSGRFHGSAVPWWVCVVGYLLVVTGVALLMWAEAVNRFFEPGVRIQSDRGHEVIDVGPYSIVRHPGYIAALPLLAGIALALGSLWALIPVALAMLALVVRTVFEDRMLRAELSGYAEYARRVRYKWIPGVW
jgi:protein-S-isoprenylcysteine O-methyltransferase Ste14